ncbi:hypothetical protein VFPPC_16872 [Pochonia chlamydosporia 170]|uniref:Uncharacterized protein n=1 Tax=Pochonia chlamydosporia 170 TaxID=1380566 RepID=A0A179F2S5_METCM|nr:hypothetical protein VFPPC_16872 [Pochonia chlamydosporia 170]OAQ59379.1 hypothetical protein VFPPC_16872 [Pochonia chlamydosporia 170]
MGGFMAGLSASRRHHQCHAAVIDTAKAARASRMSHSSRRTQACPPAELRYWIRIDAIMSVVGEFGRLSLPAPPSISSGLVGMVQTHKVKEHAVLCIGSSDLVHWNRNYPFRPGCDCDCGLIAPLLIGGPRISAPATHEVAVLGVMGALSNHGKKRTLDLSRRWGTSLRWGMGCESPDVGISYPGVWSRGRGMES